MTFLGKNENPGRQVEHQMSLLVPTCVLGFLSLVPGQHAGSWLHMVANSIPKKSPFTVGVVAPLDLSRIKINGLEKTVSMSGVEGETGH